MELDSAGLTLLKRFEGCRLTAYQDTAGIWTIGYGHTDGVSEGHTVTQAQADAFLRDDAGHTLTNLNLLTVGVRTVAFQFDALASLAFNIGSRAFRGSTVLRQHRAGNYPAAANAFLMWNKDHRDGKLVVVPGLVRRRMIERNYYLNGVLMAQRINMVPIATELWI